MAASIPTTVADDPAEHWWLHPGREPPLPPGRPLYLPSRGELFVRHLEGPPAAPPRLLLHGWTVTAELNWFTSLEPLRRHFNVIVHDHRGHGRGIRSSRRFDLADCADDAIAVADAFDVDEVIPVGYSMGGSVALLVWQRHRHRVPGLVLVATAPRFRITARNHIEFPLLRPVSLAARAVPVGFRQPVFHYLVEARVRDRDYHPWIVRQIRSGDARMLAEAGTAIGRFDARPWLEHIDVPTSVLVFGDDEIVPPERQDHLARSIPRARRWDLPGGHDLAVSRPDHFVPALVEACHHAAGLRVGDAAPWG